jgi:hypothetical protein
MPRHWHIADIGYRWALLAITLTFERISTLLVLGYRSPFPVAYFLFAGVSSLYLHLIVDLQLGLNQSLGFVVPSYPVLMLLDHTLG